MSADYGDMLNHLEQIQHELNSLRSKMEKEVVKPVEASKPQPGVETPKPVVEKPSNSACKKKTCATRDDKCGNPKKTPCEKFGCVLSTDDRGVLVCTDATHAHNKEGGRRRRTRRRKRKRTRKKKNKKRRRTKKKRRRRR
ncbi:hypothetical protein OAA99_03140 [Omnitrophica bacterium]|nr:hypothetical protein [Candidatus Omnitrophota bacterium]